MEVQCRVLDQIQKHGFFAYTKKCQFHQDEDRFLVFVVSVMEIRKEEERIEVVKIWPKLQSFRDIQAVLRFFNLDLEFIKNFSRIAAAPICIGKIINSIGDLGHQITGKKLATRLFVESKLVESKLCQQPKDWRIPFNPKNRLRIRFGKGQKHWQND